VSGRPRPDRAPGRAWPAESEARGILAGVPIDFTAIDFETANSSRASACSVGLVKVRDGRVVDRASWFIRPPHGHDEFSVHNIRVHGIQPEQVQDARRWADQLGDLVAFAGSDVMVAHNAGFDMGVIRGGCEASLVETPMMRYLCSVHIARRTYTLDSYRLPSAAMAAGFEGFAHHDALADSEACAAIVVHAARRHGASTMEELAEATGGPVKRIGAPADDAAASTGRVRGRAAASRHGSVRYDATPAAVPARGVVDAAGWAIPLGVPISA
jgi:DNA polymerase-3 subunit epsilon